LNDITWKIITLGYYSSLILGPFWEKTYVSTQKLFKYEWILFSSALNLIL